MYPYAMPGIIPAATINEAAAALPLADALLSGNVNVLEVDIRAEAGADAIRAIAAGRPDMIVGAGNVVTLAQCEAAAAAGAKFIASPCFSEHIVQWCIAQQITVLPCCYSPSEIASALHLGLDTVKFAASELDNDLRMIRDYANTFQGIKFIPTGCIDPAALGTYLASPFVRTVCTSWICSAGDISAACFDKIAARCAEAKKEVYGFQLAHVGINCADTDEANAIANTFHQLFDFPVSDRPNSVYTTSAIEVMKFKQLGTMGHIGMRCNSVERGAVELARRGLTPIPSTSKYADGRLTVVYFEEEFGGFAFHLIQRIV